MIGQKMSREACPTPPAARVNGFPLNVACGLDSRSCGLKIDKIRKCTPSVAVSFYFVN